MANAGLRVRVGAETEGFLGQMRRMDDELKRVTRTVNNKGLALGKTQRALESFAVQATGSNRVLGQLSTTLLEFGAGGVVTLGVLAGLGLLAVGYKHLTEEARKAREEQDRLVKSFEARFAPKTGPESQAVKEFNAALQKRADLTKKLGQLQEDRENPLIATSFLGKRLYDSRIATVQKDLAETQKLIDRAYAGSVTSLESVTTTARDMGEVAAKALKEFSDRASAAQAIFDSLASHGIESKTVNGVLVSSYDQVSAKLREMGDVASVARMQMLALQQALMGNIVVARHVAAINSTGTVGPLAGKTLPGVTLAGDGAIDDAREKLTNGPMAPVGNQDAEKFLKDQVSIAKDQLKGADRNAQMVRDAIWGSATALANTVVSALNIGGGGKGSQIGGALGSTAGFAAGFYFGGPIGGAIGSTLGNIAGSFIGGLFDNHKKAVDRNTDAVRQLTQAMLLNSPRGFKVESYRYDATDLSSLARRIRVNASRGGANPLMVAA